MKGIESVFFGNNLYKKLKILVFLHFSDVIMGTHRTTEGNLIDEKSFHMALSAGFANARDWDGHRTRH